MWFAFREESDKVYHEASDTGFHDASKLAAQLVGMVYWRSCSAFPLVDAAIVLRRRQLAAVAV